LEKNTELQRRYSDIRKSQAELDQSLRPPNPVFGYSREELMLNTATAGEWIAVGSLPLNFLWDRWANIDSKQKYLEAQRLLSDHSKSDVTYQVQDAYLKSHYFTVLAAQLDGALSTLDGIASDARQRMQEGDISEYELQRILIEVNKLRAEVSEAELQRSTQLNRLRLTIGYDPERELRLAPLPAPQAHPPTGDALFQFALQNRKDLKAIERLIESESAFLSHSRLKGIPEIHLAAGYKKRSDQFSGSVVQLNLEIPLFRRSQSDIEHTEAQLSILGGQKAFLLKQIATEVQDASARYRQYEGLRGHQDDLQLHTILSTSVYSYMLGELSLVEFIDGLNAFTEGMKLHNDVEIKYRQSINELARISGDTWNNEIK